MPKRIPWLRVFVEGIVIVGSILLAFGIQAAWEGRQERRQEAEYLEALRGELSLGLSDLPRAISIVDDIRHAHESLIRQFGAPDASPDSLVYWLAELSRPTGFDPPRAVLDDLVSSGGIQLIGADSLRLDVARYERRLEQLALNSERAWATWAERIQPHLEGRVSRIERLRGGSYADIFGISFGPSPFTPDYEALLSDPSFESMVAERWIRLDQVRTGLDAIGPLILRMVEMIDHELSG